MSEPVRISFILIDSDTEISTMNVLIQVIEHMTSMESLTEQERHRVAAWFADRYGAGGLS
jgi:hypothetical protein